MQNIQRHLRDWDTYQREWETKAEFVVLVTYRQNRYPCVLFPGGALGMPRRSTFTIEENIKGDIKRQTFDANLSGLDLRRFPRDFVPGRKYLVFLTPSKGSKAILSDPKLDFSATTQMSREELAAIIDVSKTKIEVESEKISSFKSGNYEGFVFTPEIWKAMRDAKTLDLDTEKSVIPFITNVVIKQRAATIADVRAYLGDPDYRHMNQDGIYYEYYLNSAASKPEGAVSGRVQLSFGLDTALKSHHVRFYKYRESPSLNSSNPKLIQSMECQALNATELRALGLPVTDSDTP